MRKTSFSKYSLGREIGKEDTFINRPKYVVCFDFDIKKAPLQAPFLSLNTITRYVSCDIPLDHRH